MIYEYLLLVYGQDVRSAYASI